MKKTLETARDWQAYWASAVAKVGTFDLFRQVDRTVMGEPEPEEQIEILVKALTKLLKLNKNDVLLDLCCGNGLVTARLSALCGSIVGVDYSDELIKVARDKSAASNVTYLSCSVEDLCPLDLPSTRLTKICMNAGLQYFTAPALGSLLAALRRLARVDLVLLFTAVPDADKLEIFYNTPERRAEYKRRSAEGNEAIGTWWDRDDLISIFEGAGYTARAIDQDPTSLAAHYRFDVLAHLSIESNSI